MLGFAESQLRNVLNPGQPKPKRIAQSTCLRFRQISFELFNNGGVVVLIVVVEFAGSSNRNISQPHRDSATQGQTT